MYEAVYGWEYPQIWTAFDLYLWDKKDKKDRTESAGLSLLTRFCFCNIS